MVSNYTDEEKLEILTNFAKNMLKEQVDIDPEFVKIINDNWEGLLL